MSQSPSKIRRNIGFLLLALAAVLFFQDRQLRLNDFQPDMLELGDDLDSYLAAAEAKFDDIRAGSEKGIVWAGIRGEKTPLAIIYAHGFSASRDEIEPVSSRVANELGANIMFIRFQGHGRSSAAMGEASVEAWLNDMVEAVEIASRLGDKVVVMATSTGAPIATWLAANRKQWGNKIHGFVFVSPNFGPQATGTFLLTWPGAHYFVPLLAGKNRACNEEGEASGGQTIWTECYPTISIIPMARIVRQAKKSALEDLTQPVLTLYSLSDQVVSPKETEQVLERWGGQVETVKIDQSGHDSNHVIIGDALSPENNDRAVRSIVDWVGRQKL